MDCKIRKIVNVKPMSADWVEEIEAEGWRFSSAVYDSSEKMWVHTFVAN